MSPGSVLDTIRKLEGFVIDDGDNFEVKLDYTAADDKVMEQLVALSKMNRLHLADGPKVTDDGLAVLKNCHKLQFLSLGGNSGITGRTLSQLGNLHLEELYLSFTGIDDDGLEGIKHLHHLRWLDLSYTKLTGKGLQHLRDLQNLENLGLVGTSVDDDGLKWLSGLTNLNSLRLASTKITGVGLNNLKGLHKLRFLTLDHTAVVSDTSRSDLQRVFPRTHLGYGFPPDPELQ